MQFLDFNYKDYKNEKIVIYGTADMQFAVTYCLNKLGIHVNEYSNRYGGKKASYYNISLRELVEYTENLDNVIVLFAVSSGVRMELEKLNEAGIKTIYSTRNLWNVVDFQDTKAAEEYRYFEQKCRNSVFFEDTVRYPNKLYVKSVDAVVSERCSLKCEGCSNLMQYYKKPQNIDVDMLCTKLDVLLDKVDELLELRILGGEPFVNPDFVKIIERYNDNPKIWGIGIYSNATIFPEEKVREHLKASKVVMRFSDYDELSRQLGKWIDWCVNNKVPYTVSRMDLWQDCGKLERHNYNKYELKDIYGNCECRNVPTVIYDKLFNCPYAANAANLGAMYKDEMDKDYLVINEQLTAEEIDDFLYNREYLEACRYCNGRNIKRASIEPHIQTKKVLDYKCLIEESSKGAETSVKIASSNEKVSIVVPVYNVEDYIERCLLSLVNQTYKSIEIIIVDDGSTDSSYELCERIRQEFCTRDILLVKKSHSGVVATRNRGIELISGKYVLFVDSDDYLESDYIERMMEHMKDNDMLCSGHMEINTEKSVSDNSLDRGQGKMSIGEPLVKNETFEGDQMEFLWKNMFADSFFEMKRVLWAKIFKTSIVQKVYQKIDEEIWMGEDRTLFQLCLLECKKISFVEEYGYYYLRRDFKSRYPWANASNNANKIRKVMREAINGHSLEEELKGGIEQDYIEFNLRALGNSAFKTGVYFYYPYFGRLSSKRVILYGAGKVGKCYYKNIIKEAECNLVAWVDKNASYIQEIERLNVKTPAILLTEEFDVIIVAVADENIYHSIRDELINMGIDGKKIIWNATKMMLANSI